MMREFDVWTHGNALQVEDPGEYASIRYRGWGAELNYAGPRNDEDPAEMSYRVCHVPLTTPSVDLENKLFLNTITVLFDTHDSCWLMRTDVWDGQNLIQSFNHNWVDGDTNEATPSANNLLSFGSGYEISQAINVSLSFYVMFVGDQSGESVQVPQTSPRATIYAVGGKFGIPAAKPVSATVGRRASGFAKSP